MTTGNRIKRARIAAGMTQTELAEKIGVKFSAIHKYESGIVVNLKRDTIAKLSEALNVSPTYLMCLDDEQKTPKEKLIDIINNMDDDEFSVTFAEIIKEKLSGK